MSTHLYLAPAAAGKTTYILGLARKAARDLATTPRVLVPTHLQARAARRRLAEMGGAIGVRILTFDQLYTEILNTAGEIYTELSDPVQFRLIRALLDGLPLRHYAPLVNQPGFVEVLQRLIGELKAARIHPEQSARAVREMGDEPRLAELVLIYAAYQDRLAASGWADRAGLGWLAVEALEQRAPQVGRDWALVAVDGFDNFTPVQLAVLQLLGDRTERLVVALTGPSDGTELPALRRLNRTRQEVEIALGVRAEPLPVTGERAAPALQSLGRGFIGGEPALPDAFSQGVLHLLEAPHRAAEVRAALRWLKARLLLDGCQPGEVALLARNISPYRPFIVETAAEFRLPVRLMDGLPLRENPAIAALLNLLALMLPDEAGNLALSRRGVIEAWRSPYFDWAALPADLADEPIGIAAGDADRLDALARWGRVIGGRAQWDEAFDRLAGLAETAGEDEEQGVPASLPRDDEARRLQATFDRFVERLTAPGGERAYREFVGWLETIIGADDAGSEHHAEPDDPTSLRVAARAREGGDAIAERDIAALVALKDVLRGLVWAEEALNTPPVRFAEFVAELTGVVEGATYTLPPHADRDEILVADVVQARGLPFRAVVVLGLAEGEFPATLGEDPFLRDADRRRLRDAFGLPLDLPTESYERELFYGAITRPRDRLLLTRSRIADNGAPWEASPFWEDARRLAPGAAVEKTGEGAPPPVEAASWPELLESLALAENTSRLRAWCEAADAGRMAAIGAGVTVLRGRVARRGDGSPFEGLSSLFEGDLSAHVSDFAARFGPEHIWSASRLEAYRSCPFQFFVSSVLGLEPREEPVEGLDARQLGNIYHHILEQVYRAAADPADANSVLSTLPAVAAAVLDDAPRREGFRATAWWARTRAEITENVRRSIEALAARGDGFVPVAFELYFERAQVARADGDPFLLHGFIDRVDRAPDGRLRVIDYKTAGPAAFSKAALKEGKKLQIALYALAAGQMPGLGAVSDGFYWHVQHAEASTLTLAGFDGGPAGALEAALAYAWAAIEGTRAGRFASHPPDEGCPSYCPAAGFCWRYRPGFGA